MVGERRGRLFERLSARHFDYQYPADLQSLWIAAQSDRSAGSRSADRGHVDPNRDAYLNRAAFANPGPLQFGNAPVYLNVRQPVFIQESFGVFKETRIFERLTNQFRLEMSNSLNRVVFGAPSVDLSSGSFGIISSQGNGARLIQLGMKLLW